MRPGEGGHSCLPSSVCPAAGRARRLSCVGASSRGRWQEIRPRARHSLLSTSTHDHGSPGSPYPLFLKRLDDDDDDDDDDVVY